MVQSMLEADEFAEDRVVATVGTGAFVGEHSIELKFRSVIAGCCVRHQTRPDQARPGDSHKAGRDALTAGMEILQSFEDLVSTRQS